VAAEHQIEDARPLLAADRIDQDRVDALRDAAASSA
jgi:hypothetical protein